MGIRVLALGIVTRILILTISAPIILNVVHDCETGPISKVRYNHG